MAAIIAACCCLTSSAVAQDLSSDFESAPPQPSSSATQPNAGGRAPLDELAPTTVVGVPGVGAPGGVTSAETVVSSANLGGSLLGETGSSVTIITAEQIQQRRETNVVEMLRGLAGVNVVQGGGPGQLSSVFIRGASSDQTKVMIDGIWANDIISTGRGFDFAALSIDNIERIEIIRGPQSTLYGSDAIGGVINIITKKGSGKRKTNAQAWGGSFGMSREAGSISAGTDKYHYSFAGSYLNTQGISAADVNLPGNVLPNSFSNGNVSGRMGWTPTKHFDVEFIFRYIHGVSQVDFGGGPFMDSPNGYAFTDQMYTRTQLHYVGEEEIWEQWLSYNTQEQTRDLHQPLVTTATIFNQNDTTAHFNGNSNLFDWRHSVKLHETNKVVFGASYYQEQGYSNSTSTSFGFGPPFIPFVDSVPTMSLFDPAVYFQDQITIGDRWFTSFGVRQDNYSLAGNATTYRATTLYRLPVTNTGIRGSVGTGFKAPSIYQLFNSQFGNPALQPEVSQGYDYGLDQPLFNGKVVLSATCFQNTFSNLIQFLFIGTAGTYVNLANANTSGTEFTALWNVNDRTALTVAYTKLYSFSGVNSDPLQTNAPLIRRPGDTASVGVNRKFLNNRANLNMNVIYVGVRNDIGFPDGFTETLEVLNPYVVANLAASYNLRPNVQLFGRVDNLTDTRYEEVYGFGVVPFSGVGGISVGW